MTALSDTTGLPLLGHAAQDDVLDVCRRAVHAARRRGRPVLASWASRLRYSDAIALWSHGRTHTERALLWLSGWDHGSLVALGTAHDLTAHGTSRIATTRRGWERLVQGAVSGGHPGDDLPTGQGPLLVGGFSFASAGEPVAPRNTPLPEALMWVPAVQVRSSADLLPMAELRLNAVLHADDDPEQSAKSLVHMAEQCLPERLTLRVDDESAPPLAPVSCAVQDLPSPARWKGLVGEAVERIRSGDFEKVVVAREVRVRAEAPFDLTVALRRLRTRFPEATVFAVGHGEHTLIGATPEYLARLHGRTVSALGLAGTVPRGSNPWHDAELERELSGSAKNQHEHEVVVRMLVRALGPLCAQVGTGGRPVVLKLANVQHLATVVRGHGVRPGLGILEFVDRLHPTPALGGHPREAALDWLSRHEGLERGWYAGTVGWSDTSGQGEFAVAIRSALVRGDTASLYAGCGIVADSDPEEEYRETLVKLRPMFHALGIG